MPPAADASASTRQTSRRPAPKSSPGWARRLLRPGLALVTLGPGVHKLEIRKPGFETYSGLVRVRPGAGTTLNVALAPEEKR